MTNQQQLAEQVSSIQKYLTILTQYQGVTVGQLEQDDTIRGAVERYLYLVTTATIDLAEALIAFRGYRMPTEYRESFEILAEQHVIQPDLAERLGMMVGFRNALAHDYADLKLDIVVRALTLDRKDIETFLKIIKSAL